MCQNDSKGSARWWQVLVSIYLWSTEHQRWEQCLSHWSTPATFQKLCRARQRERNCTNKQQQHDDSIKITKITVLNINCKDESTANIPEPALPCTDDDTMLPAQCADLHNSSFQFNWSVELAAISHQWNSGHNPLKAAERGKSNQESLCWHRQPWHHVS